MTRLGSKIPVEPLDEVLYDRVEMRVLAAFEGIDPDAPMHRPWTHRLRWLAPAAAACAAALIVFLAMRSGSSLIDNDERATVAPTRVVTSDAGSSTVTLGDAVVTVGEDSAVDVARTRSGGVDIALERGQIDCEVEPRPDRAAVVVRAGDVTVTVVGTAFRVTRAPDGTVSVEVTRGKVRVTSGGAETYVSAGESWSGPALLAAATIPASGDTSSAGEPPAGNDRRIDDAPKPGGDVDVDVDSPGLESLGDRKSRRPQTDRNSKRRTRDSKKSRSRDKSNDRAVLKARPKRGKPPASSAEFADIMRIEASDPAQAVKRYRKLSLERGPEAEFALYSAAYLQYFRLRDRRGALQSLHHYQRRFPRGGHAESALWLRIRILCEGKDRKSCRAAAHSYLSKFPSGRHSDRASQIINWDM